MSENGFYLGRVFDTKSGAVTAKPVIAVNQATELTLTPKKTDIYVDHFGIAWLPFYQVRAGDEAFEVRAFGAE